MNTIPRHMLGTRAVAASGSEEPTLRSHLRDWGPRNLVQA